LKRVPAFAAIAIVAWLAGCTQHKIQVDPVEVEVKPIHITMDINVKIDRELDDFFAFEEDLMEDRKDDGESGTVNEDDTDEGDTL
jgi:hypothetical protein